MRIGGFWGKWKVIRDERMRRVWVLKEKCRPLNEGCPGCVTECPHNGRSVEEAVWGSSTEIWNIIWVKVTVTIIANLALQLVHVLKNKVIVIQH